jgi:hypothetical protein
MNCTIDDTYVMGGMNGTHGGLYTRSMEYTIDYVKRSRFSL